MIKNKVLSEIKSYSLLTFFLTIGSIGWGRFIIPANIVGSGITGLSSVFYYLWGWDVGLVAFVFNVILVLLGIRILGFSFGIKTIYCIVMFSLLLSFFANPEIFPEPIIKDNKFMSVLIGATLGGVGGGFIFLNGGSTGGTDIIAMIINKYKNISLGKLLLSMDVIIISSSYFVFKFFVPEANSDPLETVMYGLISMTTFSYSVDMVISGNKQSVQIFIISEKYDRLTDAIVNTAGKGVTVLDGVGGYSKKPKKILMIISKKRTSQIIFKLVQEIDPDAFVTMGSVTGVYGLGWDTIKS